MVKVTSFEDLEKLRKELSARRKHTHVIAVCGGIGCVAPGARTVIKAIKDEIKEHGLERQVEVRETGCLGL